MAIIPIDDSLNLTEEVADFLNFLIEDGKDVVLPLTMPEIIMGKFRPGLDPDLISSDIISRFSEAGIPNGVLPGGYTNSMEELVKIMCEAIVDHIQNSMRVEIVTDAGATVQATGANAGGPVVALGAVINPFTGIGVAR